MRTAAVEWAPQQPVGTSRDGVEHRLHVRRRAGNDLQYLGRGRLPLQRLVRVAEHFRVLDRDHRLVGEGLEQGVLLVAEGAESCAQHRDGSDALAFPHQGRKQRREVVADDLREALQSRHFGRVQIGKHTSELQSPC